MGAREEILEEFLKVVPLPDHPKETGHRLIFEAFMRWYEKNFLWEWVGTTYWLLNALRKLDWLEVGPVRGPEGFPVRRKKGSNAKR